jgi:hypothetical protein
MRIQSWLLLSSGPLRHRPHFAGALGRIGDGCSQIPGSPYLGLMSIGGWIDHGLGEPNF